MMRSIRAGGTLAWALCAAACGGGGGSGASAPGSQDQIPSAPQVITPSAQLKTFVDVTAASGIAYETGYKSYIPLGENPEIAAHAAITSVAAGDYDADGDVDLFITRGDIGPNLLYRNNGLGVFDEVAASAGVAFTATASENYRHSAATFADMDGDRDLDLFIGGMFEDPSFIYSNDGDGNFTNVTPGSGIDTLEAENTISAAFGDYDLDGDLDMFLSHWGTHRNADNPGDTEHLWRNDSSGGTIRFTSVSEPAGISPSIINLPSIQTSRWLDDWTFTPSFARIDEDLYPDILSVADFGFTEFFRNNRDGTFTNATDKGVLRDKNGMGSAVGDYDNDGDLDWFVTSIFANRPRDPDDGNHFYQNDNGVFVALPLSMGVHIGGWGWGTCFMDFENDGDLDIYQTNGWNLEGEFEFDFSRAFEGSGGGPFVENASALGLNDQQMGRGVVCADFDSDGDVDIFQLHLGTPVSATFWRNESVGNNHLSIKLAGLAPNTEAAGARIFVTVGEVTQMREIMIGSNYASQNPTIQVFGLGSATLADEVRVQWPDGIETIESAVGAGQILTLQQPDP